MKARAPGKVVVSGAYAVLEGAPAIVTAVDRYVTADSERPADFVTPEVRAALGERPAPWFDASPLREDGRKLGLGSSAAIVVASLAALEAKDNGTAEDAALRDAVFPQALAAHREAQGGGSGIDVATSAYGGTIVAQRGGGGAAGASGAPPELAVRPVQFPRRLVVEVWASGTPASTPSLVAAVRRLGEAEPDRYTEMMATLRSAAERAVAAADADDAPAFIEALSQQCEAFDALGRAAGVPIVTDAVRDLARIARQSGTIVLPAGAGGGDVAIYAGLGAPPETLRKAQRAAEHSTLRLSVEARGVHRV